MFWDFGPLESRNVNIARNAMIAHLGGILAGTDQVRAAGIKAAAKLGIKEAGPILYNVLNDSEGDGATRANALAALGAIQDPGFAATVQKHLQDEQTEVRVQARHELVTINPAEAVERLAAATSSENTLERQAAFRDLALADSDEASAILLTAVEQLQNGDIPSDTS